MPRRLPLPESASVVVVGGGVIGTSAAFHLAEAGVDVALIERAQLGSGSTSKAAGGVRTQFSDRSEHRGRQAQHGRVSRLRPTSGLGDRAQAGGLPVRSHDRVGRRGIRGERGAAERVRAGFTDPERRRGPPPLPAARGRRHARRGLFARRWPRDPRGRGPGLRVRRAESRRPCPRSVARSSPSR